MLESPNVVSLNLCVGKCCNRREEGDTEVEKLVQKVETKLHLLLMGENNIVSILYLLKT